MAGPIRRAVSFIARRGKERRKGQRRSGKDRRTYPYVAFKTTLGDEIIAKDLHSYRKREFNFNLVEKFYK